MECNKTILRSKNTYIKNKGRSQVNNVTLYLKKPVEDKLNLKLTEDRK